MAYPDPNFVDSPKDRWKLHKVMIDRGEGLYSYCLGWWEMRPVIGFRWNGKDGQSKGNPVARGFPTWMIMPYQDNPVLVNLFEEGDREYALRFLRVQP